METVNHECYVSLEVSKLLKQAGFDWKCKAHYMQNGDFILRGYDVDWNTTASINPNVEYYSVPTLDVAQRWLREVRHRSIEVKSFVDGTVDNRGKWWIWHVYDFNPPIDWVLLMSSDCRYSTYEEAQEAGIKKALEMILEKGE